MPEESEHSKEETLKADFRSFAKQYWPLHKKTFAVVGMSTFLGIFASVAGMPKTEATFMALCLCVAIASFLAFREERRARIKEAASTPSFSLNTDSAHVRTEPPITFTLNVRGNGSGCGMLSKVLFSAWSEGFAENCALKELDVGSMKLQPNQSESFSFELRPNEPSNPRIAIWAIEYFEHGTGALRRQPFFLWYDGRNPALSALPFNKRAELAGVFPALWDRLKPL